MASEYTLWSKECSARKLRKEDLDAYAGGSFGKRMLTVLFDAGYKATAKYRLANLLYYKYHLQLLPRWLRYRNRVKYAVDIDFRAKIGGGFRILHGTGIVIGYDVRIGRNVSLHQAVTLGGNSGKIAVREGVEFSQPWLGDNVRVFSGSTIIGPVHIGSNSQVGAGTLLTKDVPENAVVYNKRETVIKEQV